ncbi:MAG: UDP-3-O-(3-hydroxymyristoyl)glucosamine N-acyltransferase [Candidatus Rokuibacteriota bacterium]
MGRRRQASRGVRIEDIARAVDGVLSDSRSVTIADLKSLEDAGPHDLAYVVDNRLLAVARRSRAGALLVSHPLPDVDRPQITVANPAYAAVQVVERFFTTPYRGRGIGAPITRGRDVSIGAEPSIWPFVTLGDRVRLGARVTVYPGAFIGDDCALGDDAVVYPNVTILPRCRIGARVVIASGTVIGSDGFGYVQDAGRHHKIPQRGAVVIEDDVELGANVTVDRATHGQTVIGRGSKIDNQVHIAHNVSIGEHTILVAQVGIAGSATIGKQVVMGGQVGVADHIRVGDGAMIAASAGVVRDVAPGERLSGTPALPHHEAVRAYTALRRLPELRQRVRDLERRLASLEQAGRPATPPPPRATKRPRS